MPDRKAERRASREIAIRIKWEGYALKGHYEKLHLKLKDYEEMCGVAGVLFSRSNLHQRIVEGKVKEDVPRDGYIKIAYYEFVRWLGHDPLDLIRERFKEARKTEGKIICRHCDGWMEIENNLCPTCGRPNKIAQRLAQKKTVSDGFGNQLRQTG